MNPQIAPHNLVCTVPQIMDIELAKSKVPFFESNGDVAKYFVETLKKAFSTHLAEPLDRTSAKRLETKFRSISKKEIVKRGFQKFWLRNYAQALEGFNFNSAFSFQQIFQPKIYVKKGSRNCQVILHIPAFVPSESLIFPEEATNFKIKAYLIGVSDLNYNSKENKLGPSKSLFHGKSTLKESAMLPIIRIPVDPFTTLLSLCADDVSENTSMMLVLSIFYYKKDSGRFKELKKQGAMHIEKVL